MIRVVHAALIALLLVSGVAGAAVPQEGWFIGGAVGSAEIEDKAFRDLGTVTSIDKKDTAWQVWGGYRLASWVAMQGRYTALGEYSASTSQGGSSMLDSGALTVDMKLILPFGDSGFDIYAQAGLGVVQWDQDLPALPGKPAVSLSDKEPVFTYGIGVRWTFMPALTVNLGVDAFLYEGKSSRQFPNPDNIPSDPRSPITRTESVKFNADILTANIGLQYNF